jgi:hypothetical protein
MVAAFFIGVLFGIAIGLLGKVAFDKMNSEIKDA